MTPDLSTTNLWLAILAIASAAQLLMFVGAAVVLFRVYRRASATVDALEHEQIRPLLLRVNAVVLVLGAALVVAPGADPSPHVLNLGPGGQDDPA